ncbi:hypothetical protein GCM10023148_02490 [Actinokineospora soli]
MSKEGPWTKAGVVIAALAIGIGYLVTAGDKGWWPFAAGTTAVPTTTAPTTPAPTTPTSAPVTTIPPPPPTTVNPDRVFWTGTITLTEYAVTDYTRMRDLDTAPPRTDDDEGDVGARDIEATWGELVAPQGMSTVAAWTGPKPTRAQCREAASAAGAELVELGPGDHACVRTSQGRTAWLQVTKFAGDQSLQAKATVWDDAES